MPIPRIINQGDSYRFEETPAKCLPADGFAWKLYLRAPLNSENKARFDSPSNLDRGAFAKVIDGVIVGATVRFSLTASASKALQSGDYQWMIRAEKTSTDEAATIRKGLIRVSASLSEAVNFDDQSDARAIVRACTETIKFLLGKGGAALSYTYNGKTLTRYSLLEVRAIRREFMREAILQDARAGKRKFKRNVHARFGNS